MILGEPILLGGKGETASIFVTGLTENDTVTASKDGKVWQGVWGTYTKILPNQPLIPTMTSDTTPSGVASCSYAYGTDYAYKAFDNDSDTYVYGATSATYPWYVAYQFQDTVSFQKISVSLKGYTSSNITFNYKLQASTDGNIWTDLTELQSKVMSSSQFYNFDYEFNQISAKYVRFYLESTTGVATCCLHSMQIYGDKETTVQGHLISKLNSYGTYTVTATDGTHTATESVLVNMATEYTIPMLFILYLYNEGDECEDVTGGWSADGWTAGINTYQVFAGTKNADNLKMSASTTYRIYMLSTNNKIDLTLYSKLKVDCMANTLASNFGGTIFGNTTKSAYNGYDELAYVRNTTRQTLEVDISSINGERYIYPCNNAYTSSQPREFTIYKIWLE